jgi:hypothetical protein
MSQLDYIPEKKLAGYAEAISIEEFEKFSEFARKRICKIKCSDESHGTGFFCSVCLDNWNSMKTLITNNHVLNADDIIPGKKIKFSLNDEAKNYEIELDKERRSYTSRKYDITIIELKKNDNLSADSFFDVDEKIYDPNYKYTNKSIFLFHYPKGQKMKFSPGAIKTVFEGEDSYMIEHLCDSAAGSSGGPLINSLNDKVFGIHKGGAKGAQNYNVGNLLKEPIIEFKNMINNNKNETENNGEMLKVPDSHIIGETNKDYEDRLKSVNINNSNINDDSKEKLSTPISINKQKKKNN